MKHICTWHWTRKNNKSSYVGHCNMQLPGHHLTIFLSLLYNNKFYFCFKSHKTATPPPLHAHTMSVYAFVNTFQSQLKTAKPPQHQILINIYNQVETKLALALATSWKYLKLQQASSKWNKIGEADLESTEHRCKDIHLYCLLTWTFGLTYAFIEMLQHLISVLMCNMGEYYSIQLNRTVNYCHAQG